MAELILCHRRSPRTGRTAFRDHWRGRRAGLVLSLQNALGFETYRQVHRTSRLDILYLGILASRSWPVTAILSALEGLPIPSFRKRPKSGRERWDAVELLSYPSRDAMTKALTSAKGRDAARQLSADAIGWSRYSASVVGEPLQLHHDEDLRWPRTTALFFLRARSPLDRGQMLERWKGDHAALVRSLQSDLGFRDYAQIHANAPNSVTDALRSMDAPPATFDGVASLSYQDRGELLGGLFRPSVQIANLKLVRDEVHFIDGRNSALVFGTMEEFPEIE